MDRLVASLAVVVSLIACADSPSAPAVALAPPEPQGELITPGDRIAPESINSHTYGSFAIHSSTGGVITSGAANFPGHPPAGPGTCLDGRWINAQGKPTAGNLEHPHPHCVTPETTTEVVLEPISSCFTGFGTIPCGVKLVIGASLLQLGYAPDKSSLQVYGATAGTKGDVLFGTTTASGWVTGYAIDAATKQRVGYLSFDIGQYFSKDVNHFDDACAIDDGLVSPCLNLVIAAFYKPFPPEEGGIGAPGPALGFLWFTPASSPYNYGK